MNLLKCFSLGPIELESWKKDTTILWNGLFKLDKSLQKCRYNKFDSAVSMTPTSWTLRCHWHRGACLCRISFLQLRISPWNWDHTWKYYSIWIRGPCSWVGIMKKTRGQKSGVKNQGSKTRGQKSRHTVTLKKKHSQLFLNTRNKLFGFLKRCTNTIQ